MSEYILEMRNITKQFPGVKALDGVQLHVRPGEIHGLIGENGAGKSTLMKILSGSQPMDDGVIRINSGEVSIRSPHDAHALGIRMVHQEFNLAPRLSVAENILLGRLPSGGIPGLLRWKQIYQEAEAALERVGMRLDVRRPVGELSIAQQQMVEIAKALSANARILVLDEPSATLTDHELETLFQLLKQLRRQDIGIIYISHRLEELFAIAQRVTVMRDGKWVNTCDLCDITREDLIRMMVGRDLSETFPRMERTPGKERLRVVDISRKKAFTSVGFSIRAGEIVGLTGLVGSGRTEVARAIFGADPLDQGEIYIDETPMRIDSPKTAIKAGIGFLTEDRKGQGLVLGMTVGKNTTLAHLQALGPKGFISLMRERRIAEEYVEKLHIKTPSIDQTARNLSGGNQQKVVLAKWLFTQSRILIFDEPTRGIDVGAKAEIYRIINELAAAGVAILVISSELPEILGLCDRILVMHEGRLTGELAADTATQESIMHLATGGNRAEKMTPMAG